MLLLRATQWLQAAALVLMIGSARADDYLPQFTASSGADALLTAAQVPDWDGSGGDDIPDIWPLTRADGVMYENYYLFATSLPESNDTSTPSYTNSVQIRGFQTVSASDGKWEFGTWETYDTPLAIDNHDRLTGTQCVAFNGELYAFAMVGRSDDGGTDTLYYQSFTLAPDTSSDFLESKQGNWTAITLSGTINDFSATVLNGELILFYAAVDDNDVKHIYWAVNDGTGFTDNGPVTAVDTDGNDLIDFYSVAALTFFQSSDADDRVAGSTANEMNILLTALSGSDRSPTFSVGTFSNGSVTFNQESLSNYHEISADGVYAYGVHLVDGIGSVFGQKTLGATMVVTICSELNYSGSNFYNELFMAALPYDSSDLSSLEFVDQSEHIASPITGVAGVFTTGVYQVGMASQSGGTLDSVQDYQVLGGMGVLWNSDADSNVTESSFQFVPGNLLEATNPAVVTDAADLASWSTQSDIETALTSYTLVGVVHGPPPFAGNGLAANTSSVTLSWDNQESDTDSTSLSQTNTNTMSISLDEHFPFLDAGSQYANSVENASGASTTTETSITFQDSLELELNGSQSGDVGWLVFLAPNVSNQLFNVYAYDGATDLGLNYYVTSIQESSLVTFQYNTTSPSTTINVQGDASVALADGMAAVANSTDVASWTSYQFSAASTDDYTVYETADVLEAGTATTSGSAFTFSASSDDETSTTVTKTTSSSVDIGVNATSDGGSGGTSWGFAFTSGFSEASSTSWTQSSTLGQYFSKSVSPSVSIITCPGSGGSSTYDSVTLRPLLVLPSDAGDGDWTPTAYSDCAPFLITWQVTRYTHCSSADGYSLTAESTALGSVSGTGVYDEGQTATATATPADGYEFVSWTGDVTSEDNPVSVTMDDHKTLVPIFIPETLPDSYTAEGRDMVLNTPEEYNLYTVDDLIEERTNGRFDVINDPIAYALYREDQLRALSASPLIAVEDGQVTFLARLQDSSDLQTFENLDANDYQMRVDSNGAIEIELGAAEGAAFYRLQMSP